MDAWIRESGGRLTCELGDDAPAAVAVGEEEADELLVLLRRPRPLLHAHLVAARLPPHRSPSSLLQTT
jgi:hypothetical protein